MGNTLEEIVVNFEITGFKEFLNIIKSMEKQVKVFSKSIQNSLAKAPFQNMVTDMRNNQRSLIESSKIIKERLVKEGQAIIRQQQYLSKVMNQGSQKIINQVNTAQMLADSYSDFLGPLRMTNEQFSKVIENGAEFNTRISRMTGQLRLMTAGLKGFRMEMLGVMFFGMMLAQTMNSILRPAAEAMGIFDIWSSVLIILFLPVMEKLLPIFLWLSDILMNLSPEMKLAIGSFVILGFVIGLALMVIGQLALGLGSIIIAFGSFGTLIGTVFLALAGLIVGAVFIIRGFIKIMNDDFLGGLSDIFIGVGVILLGFKLSFGFVFLGIGLIIKGFIGVLQGDFEHIGTIIAGLGSIVLLASGPWGLLLIAIGGIVYLIINHLDDLRLAYWSMALGAALALKSLPIVGKFVKDETISQMESMIQTLTQLMDVKEYNKNKREKAEKERIDSLTFDDSGFNKELNNMNLEDTISNTVQITQNNNVSVVDMAELERLFDDILKKTVDDVNTKVNK